MKRMSTISIVSLISTALFIVLHLFSPRITSPQLPFIFNFLYVVILPGYLLTAKLLPWTRGTLRILASFVFGTAAAFAVLFPLALFRQDILLAKFITPVIVLLLSFWTGPDRRKIMEWGKVGRQEIPPDHASTMIILVALLIFISALIVRTGDPLRYTSDSADHIAYIRTIARTHEAFPDQFYYRDGGTLTRDIRKGMAHALWGTINALSGNTSIHLTWPLISLFGSIFITIALYIVGKTLFRSDSIGLLSAFLFVLYFKGGLQGYRLVTIAAGYPFGQTFYVTALAFIPRYLNTSKPGYLLLLAVTAWAAAGTHIVHFIIAIFIILVFALTLFIQAPGYARKDMITRKVPLILAAITLINIPYLLLRYVRDYAPSNPIHMHTQGIFHITKQLYTMNPVVFLNSAGPLGLICIISLFLLWERSRREETLRLMLCGLITYYILVFNPLWYPLLLKKMSYLLIRFEFAIPPMIVSACLLRELWSKVRGRNRTFGIFKTLIGLASVALILAPPLWNTVTAFAYRTETVKRERVNGYSSLSDLFAAIQSLCPPGSVILSDPITSFGIPAFSDQYVVCPYDQHSTPNDSTAIERITDCRTIYNPCASIFDIRDVLKKYEVDYLVINGRIPSHIQTMYWITDRETAEEARQNINAYPGIFKALYHGENVTLYSVDCDASSERRMEAPLQPQFAGPPVSIQETEMLTESGEPGILVKRVAVSRARVSRGDTLQVRITWVATEELPFDSYAAHLRFDTDFEKSMLYNEAYGKLYRKIYEALRGNLYRFRRDFQPFNGIFPPDTWETMHEMRERVTVRIPENVSPGRYAVSLKITIKSQYPNYTWSEIVTDTDMYSGTVMNHIVIE